MSFFSNFKIIAGMLFGTDDLRESREDITRKKLRVKKNVFVFV